MILGNGVVELVTTMVLVTGGEEEKDRAAVAMGSCVVAEDTLVVVRMGELVVAGPGVLELLLDVVGVGVLELLLDVVGAGMLELLLDVVGDSALVEVDGKVVELEDVGT